MSDVLKIIADPIKVSIRTERDSVTRMITIFKNSIVATETTESGGRNSFTISTVDGKDIQLHNLTYEQMKNLSNGIYGR